MNKVISFNKYLFYPVLLLILSGLCFASTDNLPKGWFKAGSKPQNYECGVDTAIFHHGKSSGYIKSITGKSDGFGTLMQICQAEHYLGKRVRLSGWIKSDNISDWSGLWFRIDGPDDKPLGFDNMQNRPIQGTTDWNKYEIVLDIPEESIHLAFGVLLQGTGQVWLDDLKFEIVDNTVPLTGMDMTKKSESKYPDKPVSLNFEL